jgi:ferredoxin
LNGGIKMKRNIISIDEKKCNGCGLCVTACHEGAIELVDGKARLVSDEYCDGLGDCFTSMSYRCYKKL